MEHQLYCLRIILIFVSYFKVGHSYELVMLVYAHVLRCQAQWQNGENICFIVNKVLTSICYRIHVTV